MPHVTEEIWSFLPGERALLAIEPWPEADESLFDRAAEAAMERVQQAVTVIRRLRDLAGVKPGVRLPADVDLEEGVAGHIANLAGLELSPNGGDPVATIAGVRILASDAFDAEALARTIDERRRQLDSEIARIENKLANKGFVEKAPPEIVQAEQEKLDGYRREREALT